MKILFVADVFGVAGRRTMSALLPKYIKEYEPDFVIANVENIANGRGITKSYLNDMFRLGVDIATTGNHIWSVSETYEFADCEERMLIPANLKGDVPGFRYGIFEKNNKKLGVLCLLGNAFMQGANCPFEAADKYVELIKKETKCAFIDFHAEATGEKMALAWHLDGRVAAVMGTHTHVQTADEQILPYGTAVMCDVGMTGPAQSCIGSKPDGVIKRMTKGYPVRLVPEEGLSQFNASFIEVDESKGISKKIIRINEKYGG